MRIVASFQLALPLVALLTACSPEPPAAFDAHRAGRGTAKLYDAPLNEVWIAARAVLADERNGDVEEHYADHLGEPFMVVHTPGESPPANVDQVGVWFLSEGDRGTLVKVVVMTGMESTAGIVGPDEQSVQLRIAAKLEKMRLSEARAPVLATAW